MKTEPHSLPYQLVPREALPVEDALRLHMLMETCYDHVSFERFSEDLERKDWVLLLHDSSGIIQGFSTLALNPCGRTRNPPACRGCRGEALRSSWPSSRGRSLASWGSSRLRGRRRWAAIHRV